MQDEGGVWKGAATGLRKGSCRPGKSQAQFRYMGHASGRQKRRVFSWSEEVKQYVIDCNKHIGNVSQQSDFERQLVAKVEEMSGNPRDACLRFLKQLGAVPKRGYHPWTKPEQQRLVDLVNGMPTVEAARVLGRTTSSVQTMLHRLGLGSRQLREWFTTSLLAQCLHVSREQVQRWIDRGWLPCRVVQTRGLRMQIIDADDFCDFIEKYGRQVVGRRLSYEGLLFVRNYVCPPKHSELLSVRGTYKKPAGSMPEDVTGADGLQPEGDEEESSISEQSA
jgi:hypothetical protein